MKKFVHILLLIAGSAATASDCNRETFSINACFSGPQLTDPSQALHILGATLSTIIVAGAAKQLGLSKTEAILFSGLLNYAAWTAKEFYLDEFGDPRNNTSNLIGVGAGMLISIPLF